MRKKSIRQEYKQLRCDLLATAGHTMQQLVMSWLKSSYYKFTHLLMMFTVKMCKLTSTVGSRSTVYAGHHSSLQPCKMSDYHKHKHLKKNKNCKKILLFHKQNSKIYVSRQTPQSSTFHFVCRQQFAKMLHKHSHIATLQMHEIMLLNEHSPGKPDD